MRVVERGSGSTSKACEIHLRMHFIPTKEYSGVPPWPTGRQSTGYGDAASITIVLHEGRHLTHPDMPEGPLEPFAETFLDLELQEDSLDKETSRIDGGYLGYHRTGSRTLRSTT